MGLESSIPSGKIVLLYLMYLSVHSSLLEKKSNRYTLCRIQKVFKVSHFSCIVKLAPTVNWTPYTKECWASTEVSLPLDITQVKISRSTRFCTELYRSAQYEGVNSYDISLNPGHLNSSSHPRTWYGSIYFTPSMNNWCLCVLQ